MRQQNFNNEVQAVVEQLRIVQELMLLIPADIEVQFAERSMDIYSHDKLDKGIEKQLKKQFRFKYIKEVLLEGEPHPHLAFMSKGSIMPKGRLVLKGPEKESKAILFTGAPNAIAITAGESMSKQPSWDHLIEVTRLEIAPPPSDPS